jgi:hypothetical protein
VQRKAFAPHFRFSKIFELDERTFTPSYRKSRNCQERDNIHARSAMHFWASHAGI